MDLVPSGMVAMISDPIFIGGDNGLLKQYIGQTIFMASLKKLRYSIISSANGKNISIQDWWSINISGQGHPFYFMSGIGHNAYIPAELFFDGLKERYPQHFEWLLFHPEWLL